MKIYSNKFDLANNKPREFFVAPNSQYKIAIKILVNGAPSDLSYIVYDGNTQLNPDGTVDGFATFSLSSTVVGEKKYKIVVENGQVCWLTQTTTDSTVFEVGGEGGSTPEGNFVKSVNGEYPVNGNVEVEKLAITDGYVTGDTILGSIEQIEDELDGKADLTAIVPVAPSTSATDEKLAGAKSTAEFVNSSINALAAFYITKDEDGTQFASKAELDEGPYYNAGVERQPTQNDYAIVASDETKDGATTRYTWQGGDDGSFEYQYTINRAPLTQAQLDAINSGITAAAVNDMAKKSELAANTINLQGEYDDGEEFNFTVYVHQG